MRRRVGSAHPKRHLGHLVHTGGAARLSQRMVLPWFCSVGKWKRGPSSRRSELLLTECVEQLHTLLVFLQMPCEETLCPEGFKLLKELRTLLCDVHLVVEQSMRQRCQAEGLPYEEGDFTDDASGVVVAAGKPLGMRSIPCANCFSVASTSDIGPLRPGANGLETCGLSSSSIGCSATSPAICQCSTACTSGGASASSGPRANLRLRRARPRRPKILAQQPCWRAVAPPHSTSTAAQGLALSSSALDLADRDWRSSSWRRGALASRDEEEGCVLDDDDWDGGMGVAGYLRAHCRRSSPGLPPSAAQSRR